MENRDRTERLPEGIPAHAARAESPPGIHPGAWALWAVAAALLALTTRNPAYLTLLLLAVVVVRAARPAGPAGAAGWGFFLRAALLLWLITIPLNALTAHYGQTVLFSLPHTLPLIGSLVGGPVTLEAAAYGFLSGLALLTVLIIFATLNRAVAPYQLLRTLPPVLFQTGVMASIALSFIPQAAASLREIREAQAIRGHRPRGLRDALPLLLPLLTTGLERSLQLAEALEARGFGRAPVRSPAGRRWGQGLLLLALLLLLAGLLVRAGWESGLLSAGLLLGGAAGLLAALVVQGRSVRRTRYRAQRWTAPDALVALGAGLFLVAYAAVRLRWPDLLAYAPYPRLDWPAFAPALGALILLLTIPAFTHLVPPARNTRQDARSKEQEAGSRKPETRIQSSGSSMIRLDHVTYTYPQRSAPVLADVSLEIAAGEFLVVAGPSGSGKSTLLRTLNGLVPHFYGGTFAGRVDVLGHDPTAAGPGAMSAVVGLVFQSPEAQCVATTVEEEVAFALENHGLGKAAMRERVDRVLAELGIAHLRARRLETLSGGERQRVAIAAVLTLRPRVLVLDEPTSQIDPAGAEEVVQALVRLNRDLGLTVILCEHRLERVLAPANRLLYIPGAGRPILLGEPRAVLAEMAEVPPVVELGRTLGWTPLPLTVEEAREVLSVTGREVWGGEERSRVAGCKLQVAGFPETEPWDACGSSASPPQTVSLQPPLPAVHISGLSFSYNSHAALQDVDLDVREGEIAALMGANGAGKTTLLKLLVGLLRPTAGVVEVAGLDTRRARLEQVIEHVGYVPQNPDMLLFADTVRDELAFTLRARGRPAGDDGDLPRLLGLAAHMARYPRDLSVGERQRVALAAVLVADPRILLLDEPTRGLDYAQKEALEGFLRAQRGRGRAVVLATHDVELAARCADRIVILDHGRVLADGPAGEVMARFPAFASQVSRLYGDPHLLAVEDVVRVAVVDLPPSASTLQQPTPNLQPATGNPQPATPNLQAATCNLQPATPNLQPPTSNLQPSIANRQSPIQNPKSSITPWIIALASLTGVVSFLYPFFAGPAAAEGAGFLAHAADAPVVTFLCLIAILAGLEMRGLSSKQVALLGILAALGALLRPLPGPYGFSLLFFLPILCGYAAGPTFGFLLGALTLLVSALVTGGVGPWLPYQMLSTGWVGMLAGFLPDLRRWRWGEMAALAAFSLVLGLFFGAVMNLWFWPFLGYGADSSTLWQPGLTLGETLARYGRFYVLTSLLWDLGRGVGNVVLILAVGGPVLRRLRRFTVRFAFRRG